MLVLVLSVNKVIRMVWKVMWLLQGCFKILHINSRVNSSLSRLVFKGTCLRGCFLLLWRWEGLITEVRGFGFSRFCFSVQKNFIELYQAVRSRILLRQHLLFKIIMKNKVVKAKTFFFLIFLVFQDPISPSPTCHPADAICHLSWSLLRNKETVSWQPALCIITQEPADLQRPTIKKQIPIFLLQNILPSPPI